MKVEIVNQSLKPAVSADRLAKAPVQQHFTGISQAEKDVMNLIHHKKVIMRMKKLEWLKGEIGGIILTAIGTGAVAPIFIAFNPFVKSKKDATPQEKEDLKNTKSYTAMRQPISAALAILFQASVQKYIDKGLDAIFNNPKRANRFRENLDQSYLNTETYVKDKVIKELKDSGIKKPSYIKSLFSPKEELDGEKVSLRSKYDILVNDKVDAIRDKQLDDIAKAFEKDNKLYIGGEFASDGSIKLSTSRHLDNETLAGLVNSQIEEYQKDAQKLMKTDKQINKYVYDKAEVFMKNEKKLREMFAELPLDEIRATNDNKKLKELYAQVTNAVKKMHDKETDPKIKDLLQDILNKPEDLRANRIDRTLQRIDSIKEMCKNKGGYTAQRYLEALIERNNVLSERKVKLEACKIKDLANADSKVIEEAINKIARNCRFKKDNGIIESVLKDTDTFSSESLKSKIYKDITKGYKELVKNNYKSWNQVSKILVGVFITLPITCTALNWVYPRFMELFFPKLAGVKKNKSQDAQAQQQNMQAQKVGGDK